MALESDDIKTIADIFSQSITLLDKKIDGHITEQRLRDIDQEGRDRRSDEVFSAALRSVEESQTLRREIKNIPTLVRDAIRDCIDPKLETVNFRIDSVSNRIEQHIKDHLTYRDFKFKTWQILLGIPAIIVMLVTAAYNAYVALARWIK